MDAEQVGTDAARSGVQGASGMDAEQVGVDAASGVQGVWGDQGAMDADSESVSSDVSIDYPFVWIFTWGFQAAGSRMMEQYIELRNRMVHESFDVHHLEDFGSLLSAGC